MRRFFAAVLVLYAVPMFGQSPQQQVINAERAVRNAMERLANEKKEYESDLAILQHIRAADNALADTMQPHNAIQKAFDEIEEAKRLNPDIVVMQGVIKAERELESARLSPMVADFSHLRSTIRTDAAGPAVRAVATNAAKLQEDVLGWIKVQELISGHLRNLTEISAASARAAQQ